MKRFYCTICKRIKRVRVYPRDIVTQENENPANRLGTCTRHSKTIRSIQSDRLNRKVGV